MFENFRDKRIEIYQLDPLYFMSAPGLAWQACLKKTEVKLELITDYDMVVMIEKVIGVEFAKQRTGTLKQIINISKMMIKTMNHHN